MKISKAPIIKLKDLNEVDFDSPKMKTEIEKIKRSNKKLLESMKPDWSKMNMTFDI